jgi:hypothetical protein
LADLLGVVCGTPQCGLDVANLMQEEYRFYHESTDGHLTMRETSR